MTTSLLESDIVVNVGVDSGCVEVGMGIPFAEAADAVFQRRVVSCLAYPVSIRDGHSLLLKTRHGDGRHRLVIRREAHRPPHLNSFPNPFPDKEYHGSFQSGFPACSWHIGDCGRVAAVVDFPGCDQLLIYRGSRSIYLLALTG